MKRANELKFRSAADLDAGMARIWQVMNDCIDRGMRATASCPAGLKVRGGPRASTTRCWPNGAEPDRRRTRSTTG
jgi:L-serine deaminase